MKKILAIDVGGTKLVYALINEKGEFLTNPEKTSTPKDINALSDLFKNIISKFEEEIDITAFATAGAVNITNTKVESSTPNMPEGYNSLDFATTPNVTFRTFIKAVGIGQR